MKCHVCYAGYSLAVEMSCYAGCSLAVKMSCYVGCSLAVKILLFIEICHNYRCTLSFSYSTTVHALNNAIQKLW